MPLCHSLDAILMHAPDANVCTTYRLASRLNKTSLLRQLGRLGAGKAAEIYAKSQNLRAKMQAMAGNSVHPLCIRIRKKACMRMHSCTLSACMLV